MDQAPNANKDPCVCLPKSTTSLCNHFHLTCFASLKKSARIMRIGLGKGEENKHISEMVKSATKIFFKY